jgi:serine/threonine-protein kinase
VPSHDDGRLDIVNTATATLRDSVTVPRNPHWAAHDARGQIWTANHESNAVTRVDAATLTFDASDIREQIGTSPHAVAVNPDSTRVAVVCFDSHELYLFDVATGDVIGPPVALGRGPQDVAWTGDGARVLTTDVDDDRVSVVDVTSGEITAMFTPPPAQPQTWDGPTSIAVTPDGATAVVSLLNTGAVALIDLTSA